MPARAVEVRGGLGGERRVVVEPPGARALDAGVVQPGRLVAAAGAARELGGDEIAAMRADL